MSASSTPPGHATLRRVADVCGDEADVLALSVARFVAAGYMTCDVACWDAAFDGAEQLLGPAEGPRFVAGVVGIVRALKAERAEDWSFMPASCCRLTGHECALVALIGRGRRRAWDDVADGAAALAARPAAPRLEAAVRAAAETIDMAATRLAGIRAPARPAAAVLH
ncbi:hypothetical protein Q8W71_04335 [Methylobacterium sp. NEAU 140]|uniref:hypothetical protein n=1 Tax=Methylobacterium sp. NEAU 140 TaxID=3064945 RepID=UPI0027325AFE|nr:hypothetical protein [Methylobacterium sp. NEAU 140]MDP4021845.1 hypothetical protein [Methylobacterium sp. NEAU 140]